MKKTYQTPSVKAIEFFAEDVLSSSGFDILDPTDKDKNPTEIGPSIGIDLF